MLPSTADTSAEVFLFLGGLSIRLAYSCERDFSASTQGNFFKLNTNVHMDSRMN